MANTTLTLSNEMMQYLKEDFLERSQALNIHREGLKEVVHKANSGKTVTWNRYDEVAPATTPLAEATNPNDVDLASDTVSATVKEYGNVTKTSSLQFVTSIDKEAQEKQELMAQNASETLDNLARDEMFAGATTQFANTKASLADVAASDILNTTEIRRAVRTLKKNNAPAYKDGFYLGKVGPDTAFDAMGDTAWVNVKTYSDKEDLYKGELGKIHRVRLIECSSNQKSEASTTTVYSNFIHGKEAVGQLSITGQPRAHTKAAKRKSNNIRLIIKTPSKENSGDALDMYMTIGWKCVDAVKTLNSNWIVNVKTGASV